jgi:hypothetical protein
MNDVTLYAASASMNRVLAAVPFELIVLLLQYFSLYQITNHAAHSSTCNQQLHVKGDRQQRTVSQFHRYSVSLCTDVHHQKSGSSSSEYRLCFGLLVTLLLTLLRLLLALSLLLLLLLLALAAGARGDADDCLEDR